MSKRSTVKEEEPQWFTDAEEEDPLPRPSRKRRTTAQALTKSGLKNKSNKSNNKKKGRLHHKQQKINPFKPREFINPYEKFKKLADFMESVPETRAPNGSNMTSSQSRAKELSSSGADLESGMPDFSVPVEASIIEQYRNANPIAEQDATSKLEVKNDFMAQLDAQHEMIHKFPQENAILRNELAKKFQNEYSNRQTHSTIKGTDRYTSDSAEGRFRDLIGAWKGRSDTPVVPEPQVALKLLLPSPILPDSSFLKRKR